MTSEPRPDDPIDALLREALGDAPVPELSPGFEARLARRLGREGREPLPRSSRLLLAGYWLLAALASAAIVARTPAIPELPWAALASLLFAAAGLAVPALIAWRARRSLGYFRTPQGSTKRW